MIYGIGINDAGYSIKTRVKGKQVNDPYYDAWKRMLHRCYRKDKSKNKSYIGCSVCTEWLRFSNFRNWMQDQDWEGKALDKDIINDGNKIYSPESCAFVDLATNNLLLNNKARRGSLPQGVTKTTNSKYQARISKNAKHTHLGHFDTPEEAHQAWAKAKSELLKETAYKQSDERVKNALLIRSDKLLTTQLK